MKQWQRCYSTSSLVAILFVTFLTVQTGNAALAYVILGHIDSFKKLDEMDFAKVARSDAVTELPPLVLNSNEWQPTKEWVSSSNNYFPSEPKV